MSDEKLTYEQLEARCEYYEEALSLLHKENAEDRRQTRLQLELERKSSKPKVTEIIPSDMPDWMQKAIDEGQYFNRTLAKINELEQRLKDKPDS